MRTLVLLGLTGVIATIIWTAATPGERRVFSSTARDSAAMVREYHRLRESSSCGSGLAGRGICGETYDEWADHRYNSTEVDSDLVKFYRTGRALALVAVLGGLIFVAFVATLIWTRPDDPPGATT